MEIFKIPCQCGFEFVFEKKPENIVEVICPKCGNNKTIEPSADLTKGSIEKKGSVKNNGD